jgi:hypothetical protein
VRRDVLKYERNIVDDPSARIRRVVVGSTAFLFRDSIIPSTYLFGRLFFPAIVVDAEEMERTISESELDWTIVRPPRLIDKPYTAKYRVREGYLPRCGFSISRADEAEYFIKTLENIASIGKTLGVSNLIGGVCSPYSR